MQFEISMLWYSFVIQILNRKSCLLIQYNVHCYVPLALQITQKHDFTFWCNIADMFHGIKVLLILLHSEYLIHKIGEFGKSCHQTWSALTSKNESLT